MSESELTFPVLTDYLNRKEHPDWPRSIPWDFISPHEDRVKSNHSQSLKRLAERGGLCPMELYAAIMDIPWYEVKKMGIENDEQAMVFVEEWLKELQNEPETPTE